MNGTDPKDIWPELDAWAENLSESSDYFEHKETPYNRVCGFLGAAVVSFILWGIVIATALILAR